MLETVSKFGAAVVALILFGIIIIVARWFKKAQQGQALVRTGLGGTKVSFTGMLVFPVIHRLELMDISLKTVVITRTNREGLICKDNMRADIQTTFFVKVNSTREDVMQVAQAIGCERASSQESLETLFDAKFSEALKTVGKHFDFIELYNSRDKFKEEILQIIGTDLNGYVLDDCAIDFLEQTPITALNEQNILDAEGIKKIIELTARQKILSNQIEREKEKTIKQQDVEAREAILELEKQQTEKEEKQKREIANIKSREMADAAVVQQNERLKAERARIATEEELQVANENKYRQIIVAAKNKERTEAIETERVEKDRMLEATERERVVTLAEIEKERAVEVERKNIQEVIRERIAVQKAVVQEEELIKDTVAFAEAERLKSVAITNAEKDAEEVLVRQIKAADAAKQAAEFLAGQKLIEAQADLEASTRKAEAVKILAEADVVKNAAEGLSEARVMEAKATAKMKDGEADASVIEHTQRAIAKGIEMTAEAEEKKGMMEAKILEEMLNAEAKGLLEKAEAMKQLDGLGREHEEYRLRLEQEKAIKLAQIDIQRQIAESQAQVISEALKNANIDIIGGETMFFDKIIGSIAQGKSIDGMIGKSDVLSTVKDALLPNGDGRHTDFATNLRNMIGQFGLNTEDVKNLSIAAIILKMSSLTDNSHTKGALEHLLNTAKTKGFADKTAAYLEVFDKPLS